MKIGPIDNSIVSGVRTPLLVTPEHPFNKVLISDIKYEEIKVKDKDDSPAIVIEFQSLEEPERTHREIIFLPDVTGDKIETVLDIFNKKMAHLWDELVPKNKDGKSPRPENGLGGKGKYRDSSGKLKEGETVDSVNKENLITLFKSIVEDFNTFGEKPIYSGVHCHLKLTYYKGNLRTPNPNFIEKFKFDANKVLRPTTLTINPKYDKVDNKVVESASPIAENPFGTSDNGGFPTFGG